jgi:hypothetical protein
MPSPSARRGSGPYRWSTNREPDRAGSPRRPRLLLICDYRPREAATVLDHIEAIRSWSRSDVFVMPTHGDLPDELDLDAFDGLVIHYNVVMVGDSYLSPFARWRISRYRGTKGAFIQDEYRFVDRTIGVMRAMGINVLFTCVPEDQVPLVYAPERLPELRRTVTVMTGYVAPELLERPVVPYAERPIDVGYRARRLPPWLGKLGMEKAEIADRFSADAPAHGLRVDISTREEDRMYGEAWLDFLGHAKAMLGVESGASVFDFDGSIEERTRAYQAAHPDAPFEEVHREVLAEVDGRIRLNQISPRCFEAAALGTLLVLYPGDYSGVLEAGRHYVPLEKDHRNMAEVVAAIRDQAAWERITARARSEVAENPRYAFPAMVAAMDDGLDLEPGADAPLDAAAWERMAARNFARHPVTVRHAGTPARTLRGARQLVRRGSRLVTPSATAPVLYPPGQPAPRDLRRRIRLARARAHWALRRSALPPALRREHGDGLLEELSELIALQEHGHRSIAVGAGSPFALLVNRPASELRIVLRQDVPEGAEPQDEIPADLGWVTAVEVDLSEPWFVPTHVGRARTRPLGHLSKLVQARPDIGRRLLAGEGPWSAVALVSSRTDSRQPSAGAGGG